MTTLDDFVLSRSLPRVRLIKCDAQDHEAHVFRGAARLLQRDRPTILVEQTDSCFLTGDVSSMLAALGYAGFVIGDRGLRPLADWQAVRRDSKAPYFNYLYRPSASAQCSVAA